jgi:hypothetical protein
MELKFEEIDDQINIKTQDTQTNEVSYTNYWSNANPIANESTNQKKPKVSYDDILSSLNMVVNNGVLQFAKPIQQPEKQQATQTQPQKKSVTIREPVKHQAQNNYITNKYFKDYKDESQGVSEDPVVPLTKEEYRQMLIQDYINRQQAQRRISQIKSRRLLFDTQHINIAPTQMPRDMNKLFKPFKR